MNSLVCCNPIHVDDEQIDMDLEDVWELQRQRSKGGRGTNSERRGRLNFLRGSGSSNRRGFSLTRNKSQSRSAPMENMNNRRPMSTGKARVGRLSRSRSPWGRKGDKKVSINKYVEKIETKPVRPMSRGRRRQIATPIQRRPSRSRSWSLGRRKANNERNVGIVRVRSRSKERQKSLARPEQRQHRRFQQSFDDDDDDDEPRQKRKGIFGRFRRRETRDGDEWSSSDDSFDEYSTRGGQLGGFFNVF